MNIVHDTSIMLHDIDEFSVVYVISYIQAYTYTNLYKEDEIVSGTRVFPIEKVEAIGRHVQITKLSSLNALS